MSQRRTVVLEIPQDYRLRLAYTGPRAGGQGHTPPPTGQDTVELEPCLPAGMICSEGPCGEPPSCRYVLPGYSCEQVPDGGHCSDDHLFYCENGELKVKHCYWLYGQHCVRVGLEAYDCSPFP